MSKYLLIKLTDNWITNEQIKAIARYYLGDKDCEIIENGVTPIVAVRNVPREYYDKEGDKFLEYLKESLATQIGTFLMENGYLAFFKEKKHDKVMIRASLNIIDERSDENDLR